MPRAASLAADVKQSRGIEATLIKGMGGAFEVVLDGKLLFSKKQTGRFPSSDEILEQIPLQRIG